MIRCGHVAVTAVLVLLLGSTLWCSLALGAVAYGADTVWFALAHPASPEGVVVTELRLPRALLAMLVGASLAGAGGLVQGLFRNPLADPGLLGVSPGAAAGAALAIVAGCSGQPLFINLAACLGAGLCTTLVYLLGRAEWGLHVTRMLLVGVAINALVGALIAFLSYAADDQALRNLTFWLLGSFSGAGWNSAGMVVGGSVVMLLACSLLAAPLNVLALGESEARHLGIDVRRTQVVVIVAVAISVGLAVATVGTIGFVGLVVPHAMRLLLGADNRRLLPASLLAGAWVMLLADLVARQSLAPAELPVGIFTALIGAPCFLVLLVRGRRVW